ncbi:ATP-binding protein [Pseudanabaena sp. FACHB-1998]|uniref:ATP-binding protein n=1 Tax=Pseudanabaena sp. FACHB-1998 TaxID=2692858 RepID=UPI001680CBFA|nr:ATP-binding protein [Pseudanabaena sp. FACHB-1998]MBD2175323.1 ATP-binding protein [Pseudanabaena sp. FACHB-1998]
MDKQEFDSKRKGLTPTQKVDFEYFLKSKNDDEIAALRDVDRSSINRNITNIATVFGIKRNKIKSDNGKDSPEKKVHRQKLLKLCLTYIPDEVTQPHIYDEFYEDLLSNNKSTVHVSDRPSTPPNPQNIPILDRTQELTPLEFIGRDRDLTNLTNLRKQYKLVLVKSGAGVGKSTLAREFLQTNFKKVIRIEMGLESGNVTPAEEKVSQILRKDFDEEPSRDFGINLGILGEKLADRANPIGVLIDNLEPALDENYRFREKLRGYDALLAVLGDRDVFSFTLITSRRSLIATRAKVHEYSLEGLDITAWRQYFHDYENGADSDALVQMRDAYNGNAKVMDILHGAIKNRFDGNIGAYWSRYKDALLADSELETLISVEMDWLRDNQPDAYKLLCRMGCYRYQDVKTVPFEGLICLLWDVPESRRACVVDYLIKSSLIEVKGEYYLHPAVRECAKLRLIKNKIDWETTNRKAAQFFMHKIARITTVEDAVLGFEVIHHYFEVNDYELSASVIFELKDNDEDEFANFGFACWRLGFSQQIILVISKILEHENMINNIYFRAGLYRILGYAQNQLGNIHEAMKFHELSGELSKNYFKDIPFERTNPYHFSMFNMRSSYFSNIGLCY